MDFSGQYAYAQYENTINNILTPEAAFYNVYSNVFVCHNKISSFGGFSQQILQYAIN